MRQLGIIILFALVSVAPVHAAVLYDGSLNSTPDAQGWLYLTEPDPPAGAAQTVAGGGTLLETFAFPADKAGYFGHPLAPVLNRTAGYSFAIDLQIENETHSSSDRAGFSIILLSSDLQGIELSFWTNEIWAQNAGFTHGESATVDMSTVVKTVQIDVQGTGYEVFVDSSSVLTGSLRDYDAAGAPAPYDTPNFLLFGNNSASAGADALFTSVSFVPEPMTIVLLGFGGAALLRRRRSS